MKFKKKLWIGIEVIKSKLFNKKIPLVVGWAITKRCNYHCKYCGGWKKKTKELSTKQVLSIIDELKQLGCQRIVFTGGEPLLRKDIGLIVNYCKEKDLTIGINSNGSLFRKRINELKKIDFLTLSLDGPEEIQDKLKANGSYKKVIVAIKTAKKNNINISLTTVISKLNLSYLKDILKIAKEYNTLIYFQPISMIYDYDNLKEFKCPSNKYRKLINELITLKRKGNKQIGNSVLGLRHLRNWPKPKKIKCAAGIVRCRIEPNGDIYPCGRLIEKITPQNCMGLGFKEAFNRLEKLNCSNCWCFNDVELNLAYSLKLSSIKNLLNTLLK